LTSPSRGENVAPTSSSSARSSSGKRSATSPTESDSTPSPRAFWQRALLERLRVQRAVAVQPQDSRAGRKPNSSACSPKKSSVARHASMLTGCHQVARAPPALSSDDA
jgi:hypothetical protein